MIDYDSFCAATLWTFYFSFHAGAKELIHKNEKVALFLFLWSWANQSTSLQQYN